MQRSWTEELHHAAAPIWTSFRDDPGNQAVRNALVTHYLPIATRHAARVPGGPVFEREDIEQDLAIVLLELVEAYDPFMGVPFHKYASQRLSKRLASCIRLYDNVKRWQRDVLGIDPQLVPIQGTRMREMDHGTGVSAFTPCYQMAAPPEGNSTTFGVQAERLFRKHLLRQLPERKHRLFVLLRWWRGHSLEQIAQRFSHDPSWAWYTQRDVKRQLMAILSRPDLADAPCANTRQMRKAAA
jgi:hypothetical protein